MIPQETIADLSVLNVSAGDVKLSFDKEQPEEIEKAKRVVSDMLRRGYMIFVEVEGKLRRVYEFDAETCSYLIEEPDYVYRGTSPPKEAEAQGGESGVALETSGEEQEAAGAKSDSKGKGKRGSYRKKVPAAGAKATAVPRSGGG